MKTMGEEVRAKAEKEEKDATKVGAGGSHKVGFGVLGRLGVEGEIAGLKREQSQEQQDAGSKDGEGHDLLAKAGSGSVDFWFSHRKRVGVMKRTDGFFQGNFTGGPADFGDNLSPWLWS